MKEDEQTRIWAVLESQLLLKDLATFALNTAMRPGNILELTWDRINMDEQEALVPASQHKQSFAGHYLLNNKILNLLKRRKAVKMVKIKWGKITRENSKYFTSWLESK
ncbi:MAG: tyrosine-type recombinase/integrase [Acidobacteria bacterium]|nr:tyrosine-type recombinase/integrase [Acidobacteriota bacterium]MBU4495610.1 tyrosine-type recombinase/integrase [Acidobacteriota bacterium]